MMQFNTLELWIVAFFTLALFSFLYKDNPVYKVAEHIFAGLSAGYYVGLIWDTVIIQQLWDPIWQTGKISLIIPGILGFLMFTRFSRKVSWVSRVSLAFVMGTTAGIFLISQLHGLVLPQMQSTMTPNTELVSMATDTYADNTAKFEVVDASLPIDTLTDTTLAQLPPEADPVVPEALPPQTLSMQSGSVEVGQARIDRLAGDSAVITARFTDTDQPDPSKFLVTLKVRSAEDNGETTLVDGAKSGEQGLPRDLYLAARFGPGGGGVRCSGRSRAAGRDGVPDHYRCGRRAFHADLLLLLQRTHRCAGRDGESWYLVYYDFIRGAFRLHRDGACLAVDRAGTVLNR